MKIYSLFVTSAARDALQSYVDYIADQEKMPLTAERWYQKAWRSLQTLKTFPHRCQYAPENEWFDFEVRALVLDNCLFLYTVDETTSRVLVFGFRHGAQEPLAGD